MTSTPISTKIRLEFSDGKHATMSGFKTDIADAATINTAFTLNQLQDRSARDVFKVEEAELSE